MKRLKRDLRGTRDASEVNERKGGVPGREILRRDRGATTRQKNDKKESCITRFGRQLRKFQFIPVSKGLVHPFKCHASATNAPNEKTGDFYAFGIRHAHPKRRSRLYCTTGNSVDTFVEYFLEDWSSSWKWKRIKRMWCVVHQFLCSFKSILIDFIWFVLYFFR